MVSGDGDLDREPDRFRWIKEAVHIRKEEQAVN